MNRMIMDRTMSTAGGLFFTVLQILRFKIGAYFEFRNSYFGFSAIGKIAEPEPSPIYDFQTL